MIEGKYFIMMYSQNGQHIMPIVDEDEIPELFDSYNDAEKAAESQPFASAFGYEIHIVGGECS